MLKCVCFMACVISLPAFSRTELMVGAAASLQTVLPEIDKLFRHDNSDIESRYNFVASSFLVMQATKRAPLDLVITADLASLAAMEKLGIVQRRKNLLANNIVLIAHKNMEVAKVSSLAEVTKLNFKWLATCEAPVPLGVYVNEILRNANLESALRGKIVYADNARGVFNMVASGAAQLGFVYGSDVYKPDERVRLLHAVDARLHAPIVYPAAIVTKNKARFTAAAKLFAFWDSEKAKKVFRAFGFTAD